MHNKNLCLPYTGGKAYLADSIVRLLPKTDLYIEPFAGGAKVFFAKEPTKIEVLNDVDEDLITLYRVLQDTKKRSELLKRLKFTLYEEKKHIELKRIYKENNNSFNCLDEVERAHSYFYLLMSSFNKKIGIGFSYAKARNIASRFTRKLKTIVYCGIRLKNAIIHCRNAMQIFDMYDTEDAVWYLDPPYLGNTRCSNLYTHEFADEKEHIDLLERIKKLKGYVILSGYPSELYNSYLDNWFQIKKNITLTVGSKTKGLKRFSGSPRIEVLWLNEKAQKANKTLDFGKENNIINDISADNGVLGDNERYVAEVETSV